MILRWIRDLRNLINIGNPPRGSPWGELFFVVDERERESERKNERGGRGREGSKCGNP